ncbi:FtsX-like permease family protein [Rhodocytophaga rosea]|uniref:FtsX-like permease family protein n=1 Tax=Rhodocytophaga rosea TaxID=2704465 RepID=A0A6C0GSJ2_9BACT|nr:ABC transporter permease [Rhodocytophaga rosea]QHT70430.1 FtsX-like permease family protein [Rhodocytophaga rosea]
MLKNYVTIALRTLWNNKVYSFLNMVGLAVGLAAGILMLLWVQDELSYDSFHSKTAQIYKLVANFDVSGKKETWSTTPAPIAIFGKREVPEIADAVRIQTDWNARVFEFGDKSFIEKKGAYADAGVFNIFDFPLIAGNPRNLFPNNRSIVITQKFAAKYFGNDAPIGKTIRMDKKDSYTVSGLIADIPANSSIQYEWFVPFSILDEQYNKQYQPNGLEGDWGNYNYSTFFLLKEKTSPVVVAKKLTKIHASNQKEANEETFSYGMNPLSQLRLYNDDGSEGSIKTVRIFTIVAIVILLIACINYVNLATARATKRAKEVSVRKIVGAQLSQVFGQFMGESILLFSLALFLAILLISAVVPVYNEISGKTLEFSLSNPTILLVLGATMLGTIIVAGIYPALLLSSFKPVQALKGKFTIGGSTTLFRKILVVTQFSMSIILIISTLLIGEQLTFMREKELGYDKDNVFAFGLRGEMYGKKDAIKSELIKQAGVTGVSFSNGYIVSLGSSTSDIEWPGKKENEQVIASQISTDKEFMDVFKLHLKEGEWFSGTKADSSKFILNETAVKAMGFKEPVLGQPFTFHGVKGSITGIVQDFHFASMHQKINPIVLFHNPNWFGVVNVKTTGKSAAQAIASAEKVWKQYQPDIPFEYNFMNEAFDLLYKSEQRTARLFNIFAGVAILISCLGLFGLAAFTAEQRTKEIGVRKVLGASVTNITALLSKDFIKLVVLSNLIAWPIAWYMMHKWLENFAYQIPISLWVFALAGILALLIALLTISYQSVKAALANPVRSLRSE